MIYWLATFQSHTPRTWKEHLSLSACPESILSYATVTTCGKITPAPL